MLIAIKALETYNSHKKNYIHFYMYLQNFEIVKKVPNNRLEILNTWFQSNVFIENIFFIQNQEGYNFSDSANLELIRNSIFKLQSFFYMKYLSALLSACSIFFIGFLTFCLILL